MKLRLSLLPAYGVFATAARYQNFAHAAEELHITASAVSHHVRKLEATLGIALFQRHARGAVLTPAGRALAEAAAGALTDLDSATDTLHRSARANKPLRITMLHSLAYCWLVPKLPRLAAAHPNIRLNIETSMSLARFDAEGPDIGIRHGQGQWPGLVSHHLMDEEIFPVAARELATTMRGATAADIARLPLIGDDVHQGWADWFRAAGVRQFNLKELHTFNDSTDAMLAASHGLGAALARTQIAAPYLASGQLVRLPGPIVKARFSYYIVHAVNRRLDADANAFISWLRDEGRADQQYVAAALDPGKNAQPVRKKARR